MKKNILVCLLLLSGIFFDWQYALGADPVGFLDGAGCSGFSGWACDADNYGKTIDVHFYADGTPGIGVFLGATTANTTREAAVGNQCGGNVNHGFSFAAPESLKDGKIHTINAYAINTPSGNNPLLSKSGKTISCCAGVPMPIKFIGTAAADPVMWTNYGRQLSSILVNKDLLVDLSCWTSNGNKGTCGVARLQQYGVDLNAITNILITHHHLDHFDTAQMVALAEARNSTTKLTLYGGITVVNQMKSYLNTVGKAGILNVVHLIPFEQAFVGSYAVTPLIANHDTADNEPYVYMIQYGGKQFLYGTDSGTLVGASLAKIYAAKFDLVIRERTFDSNSGVEHMDKDKVAAERADWVAHGVIGTGTPYYLTHIAYCAKGSCSIPDGTTDPGDGAEINMCLSAPVCTDECASGAKQCSGNGYQTCGEYDSDGCAEWSGVANCASNQNCQSGSCITNQLCAPNAVSGCKVCNAAGSAWVDTDSRCSSGQKCQGGVCVTTCTDQCAGGTKQCSGNGVQNCGDANADGCTEWGSAIACATNQTCSAGVCLTTCNTHASKQCFDSDLYWYNSCGVKEDKAQECGADTPTTNYQCAGTWIQRETVKKGCSSSACFATSVWNNNTNCVSSNKVCSNAACVALVAICANQCTKDAKQCSGSGYQTCSDTNGDGCTEWGSVVACASNQTCQAGDCQSNIPAIITDIKTCTADAVSGCKVCKKDGSAWQDDSTKCPQGLGCSLGVCVASAPCKNECSPNQRQCAENGFQYCQKNLQGCYAWSSIQACAANTKCQNGTCPAQTNAAANAMIQQLQQRIALLVQQLEKLQSGDSTTIHPQEYSCALITKNLYYGMKNDPQVKCLQEVLRAQGFGVVATGDYGGITKTAVMQFQQKYAREILAPYHLTRGSGNVGNATKTKLNSLIVAK